MPIVPNACLLRPAPLRGISGKRSCMGATRRMMRFSRMRAHSLIFAKLTLTHVLLNLPMRFLCKEDCKGFEKYEEVNQHKHCRDDANVQRPFAALQQLLAEKSDNKE